MYIATDIGYRIYIAKGKRDNIFLKFYALYKKNITKSIIQKSLSFIIYSVLLIKFITCDCVVVNSTSVIVWLFINSSNSSFGSKLNTDEDDDDGAHPRWQSGS